MSGFCRVVAGFVLGVLGPGACSAVGNPIVGDQPGNDAAAVKTHEAGIADAGPNEDVRRADASKTLGEGGVSHHDSSSATDAGDTCTLGAKQCQGESAEVCAVQTNGRTDWNTTACAANQFCSVGVCRCNDATCVRITGVTPVPPYHLGDAIVIQGRFPGADTGAISVAFDQTEDNSVSGLTVTQIATHVPGSLPIPNATNQVTISVANGTSQDEVVVPIIQPPNRGEVDVELVGVTPNPPSAGQPATFQFPATSGSTSDGVYAVAASLYNDALVSIWGVTPPGAGQIASGADGGVGQQTTLSIPSGRSVAFAVQINSVPNSVTDVVDGGWVSESTGTTPLNLLVELAESPFDPSQSGVTGTSGFIPFRAGTQVSFSPTTYLTFGMARSQAAGVTPVPPVLQTGGEAVLATFVGFFGAPGTYDITASMLGPSGGWSASLLSSTTVTPIVIESSDPVPQSRSVDVVATPGSNASPTAQLQACVTLRGTGAPSCFSLGLVL